MILMAGLREIQYWRFTDISLYVNWRRLLSRGPRRPAFHNRLCLFLSNRARLFWFGVCSLEAEALLGFLCRILPGRLLLWRQRGPLR
jgi:hypothetical protein